MRYSRVLRLKHSSTAVQHAARKGSRAFVIVVFVVFATVVFATVLVVVVIAIEGRKCKHALSLAENTERSREVLHASARSLSSTAFSGRRPLIDRGFVGWKHSENRSTSSRRFGLASCTQTLLRAIRSACSAHYRRSSEYRFRGFLSFIKDMHQKLGQISNQIHKE